MEMNIDKNPEDEQSDLISKKELLSRYGISYGALYRWKRKGLIPDEWFIRRSAPTGQETFFKRDAICERIDKILDMRDTENISLDDMADILYPKDESRVIMTVYGKYGEREFSLSEISRISLTDKKTGEIKEIFNLVKEIMK